VGDSIYSATKAGLESFSKVINKEGHAINITVNNIGISGLDTGMLKQIVGDNPDVILDIIPHKNLASIDSIIKIIEFFCSEHSSDIGSQTVYLGGIS
jgi:NAD(P)-dependent dehydrogenase (short-subunit alcohol dehydrogenase family)